MEKKLPDASIQANEAFDRPAPLRLMFQDEARFGRISHTRYCGCPKPFRPFTHAMVTQEYTYAYAAGSPGDGVLDTLILPSSLLNPPLFGGCFPFLKSLGVILSRVSEFAVPDRGGVVLSAATIPSARAVSGYG